MDAYVDVPAVKDSLLRFNASAPIYVGQVTYSHGPNYEKWEAFAHGLGYGLSRGALQAANETLLTCLEHLASHRLESIEDMVLASCLRRAKIYPQELGFVNYAFAAGNDADAVMAEPEVPLIVHPAEAADMHRLHAALAKRRAIGTEPK
eukprot:gnl/TRDRNA2_/TRDRNA2_174520_c0_seq1.p1 gnl/TRDRNA2_/TRDRNA2_174520_c0~~gnl/TRDRNA2_/TRDRNA2_174520_c0_seq1.p1  ORF type:complete len:149 (-),score=26.69 gnl/TRDRNA2_/TRDRNA2_174520_c0_seq1:32-478(-)